MIKRILLPTLLSVIFLSQGFSQQETDLQATFLTAESYFLFEEFKEALPLYLRIHRAQPENDNINYKIGVCFLNDPFQKEKAIIYLEKASENINPRYRQNNFKETAAPTDAVFYLGNAYFINNQIDNAREQYNKFLKIMDTEVYDRQLVLDQIDACDAAARLEKKPIDFDRRLLPSKINTRFSEKNPVVSGDETRLAYIAELQFYDAVFFTEKINGNWTEPRNIVAELGVDGDVYPVSMSYKGDRMYIYRNDDFIGNLYQTTYSNGKWGPLVKLNENINTKYWESHASETRDGKTLYFSSNRKGGMGDLDIYRSEKMPNGGWGPAVNLGSVVNSIYNDDTPFITASGDKLFFSSYGHYNMGGYDIFMTRKNSDGSWAAPVNLGYPVNTTDDDQFFNPVGDGEKAYYSRYDHAGAGLYDIYEYTVYNADYPRMFPISGLLDYMGTKTDSSEVLLSVIDKLGRDTLLSIHPNRKGEIAFKVPAGTYQLVFDSERFHKFMMDLEVDQNTPHSGLILPGTIKLQARPLALTQEEEDKKLQLQDTLIIVDEQKEVRIKYNAERGSDVVINVFNNDSILASTDSLEINRRRNTFEFVPEPGKNKVVITLTDEEGNVIERSAEVIYNAPESINNIDDNREGMEEDGNKPITEADQGTVEDNMPEVKASDQKTDANISLIKDKLSSLADGRLKEFIDGIDLEKEGIRSLDDLIKYLKENAAANGYTMEEVDDLLSRALSEKDLNEFIADMKRASEGNLRKTLSDFNPEKENIGTPRELIDRLMEKAVTSNYKESDVAASLAILAAQGNKDPQWLLNALKNNSTDKLRDYLENYTLDPSLINAPAALGMDLYSKAETGQIDKSEFLDLLTKLAVSRNVEALKNRLAQLAEGDLKSLLDSLDLQYNQIYTADSLIKFLYNNKYNLDYTDEDVDKLLSDALGMQMKEIDDLRRRMAVVSEEELKDFLTNYDVREGKHTSPQGFIDYLKRSTRQNRFTEEDINWALLRLAFKGDPDDIARELSKFSFGDLQELALTVDPYAESIKTTDELINYFIDNSKKHDYTKDDFTKAIADYSSYGDALKFLEKLINLAEGETRTYLHTIDPVKQGLRSKQDVILRLLKDSDDNLNDKKEIISLILRAEELSKDDIQSGLKSLAESDLAEAIDNLPADMISADEAFTYLLQNPGNAPYTEKEVLDAFTRYLKRSESV